MRIARMAAMGFALAAGALAALLLAPDAGAARGDGSGNAESVARAFLASLSGDQHKQATFALDAPERLDCVPEAIAIDLQAAHLVLQQER